MAGRHGPWRLDKDEFWLQHWIGEESPPIERIAVVRAWLESRKVDPFAGGKPVPTMGPEYRHGFIPGTMDGDRRVVTCGYRIDDAAHTVVIDMISTQSWPVS
jgi:hypothetical protein